MESKIHKKLLYFLSNKKFFFCLTPWQTCILAGIITIVLSVFFFLWSTDQIIDEANSILFYLLFSLSFMSISLVIASFILFYGIYKKNKWFFVPWIIILCIIVLLILCIGLIELSIPNQKERSPCIISLAGFIVVLIICVILIYCLLAVFKQYFLFNQPQYKFNQSRVQPTEIEISRKVHHDEPIEKGVKFMTDEKEAK